MRINTNVSSLTAQDAAQNTSKSITSSLEKLSTGLRINKASDDASGLAIADKLRTQATSINQGIANGNSAVTLLQIADKSMAEQSNILDTIKAKLVQANTDTTSADGREAIRKDVAKLLEQLDNIAEQTNYNGKVLLQSSAGNTAADKVASKALNFQVGESKNDIVTNSAIQSNTTGLGAADTAAASVNQATITAANSQKYSLTVNGTEVSYESDSTATVDEIHAGLKAAIENNSELSGNFTVSAQNASGDTSFVVTNNNINQATTVTSNSMAIANLGGTTIANTTAAAAGTSQVSTVDAFTAFAGANGDTASISIGGNAFTVDATSLDSSGVAIGTTATAAKIAEALQVKINENGTSGFTATVNGSNQVVLTQTNPDDPVGVAITALEDPDGAGATASSAVTVTPTTAGTAGVKQLDTVTFGTPNNSATYVLKLDNETVSFNSDASATANEIAAGLKAAIEANETLNSKYTMVAGATLTIEHKDRNAAFTSPTVTAHTTSANLTNVETISEGTGKLLSDLKNLGENGLTKQLAGEFQSVIDSAITDLNGYRGDIGSTQNQVESAVRNLMTQATNVKAAESIIRDVDYAAESANFNKQNIISQAGAYAISQANAVQQNVLRLLQ